MSDSEASEQFTIENLPEDNKDKVAQVLAKGKTIAPFYDEETLYYHYKESFQTEQVFLNKLEMIAKKRNLRQQEDGGWIQMSKKKGQAQRPVTKERNGRQRPQGKERYNFLVDFELIERSKQLEDIIQRFESRRQHFHNQNLDRQDRNTNKYQKRQRNNERTEVQPEVRSKKLKYVEKEQDKPTQQPKEIIKLPEPDRNNKSSPKKVDQNDHINKKSKLKFVEKPEVKAKVQDKAAIAQNQASIDKQIQKQIEAVIDKPSKKEPIKTKFIEKVIKTQAVQNKIQPSPSAKSQIKAQVKSQIKVEEKPVISTSKNSSKILTQTKKEGSNKTIGAINEMSEQVQRQFEKSCSQNSFVLRYITPSQTLQKVSYIRLPNGQKRDIKIRQVRQAI